MIWFVTDVRSGKEHEIEAEHDVCLVFIDAEAKAYLSITARAEVRHDHAKAAETWKSTDNMWWSGPNDPNVSLPGLAFPNATNSCSVFALLDEVFATSTMGP